MARPSAVVRYLSVAENIESGSVGPVLCNALISAPKIRRRANDEPRSDLSAAAAPLPDERAHAVSRGGSPQYVPSAIRLLLTRAVVAVDRFEDAGGLSLEVTGAGERAASTEVMGAIDDEMRPVVATAKRKGKRTKGKVCRLAVGAVVTV